MQLGNPNIKKKKKKQLSFGPTFCKLPGNTIGYMKTNRGRIDQKHRTWSFLITPRCIYISYEFLRKRTPTTAEAWDPSPTSRKTNRQVLDKSPGRRTRNPLKPSAPSEMPFWLALDFPGETFHEILKALHDSNKVQKHCKVGHRLPKRCGVEQVSIRPTGRHLWEPGCSCASRTALRKKQQNMGIYKKVKQLRGTGAVFSLLCIRGPYKYHEST